MYEIILFKSFSCFLAVPQYFFIPLYSDKQNIKIQIFDKILPLLSVFQIETFKNHLEWSPTRDPEEEELELGQQTQDYVARKLYLTEEEKAACMERFEASVSELHLWHQYQFVQICNIDWLNIYWYQDIEHALSQFLGITVPLIVNFYWKLYIHVSEVKYIITQCSLYSFDF